MTIGIRASLGPKMADTSAKLSLQNHEKKLRNLGERMDLMQEQMTKNLEQTSAQMDAFGDQIAQINQRLQSSSEEMVQKVTEALDAFHRSEREMMAAAEISINSSQVITPPISLEPPPPSTAAAYFIPPLQFGTTTTFIPSTNNQPSTSIPCSRTVLDPATKTQATPISSPNMNKPPSKTHHTPNFTISSTPYSTSMYFPSFGSTAWEQSQVHNPYSRAMPHKTQNFPTYCDSSGPHQFNTLLPITAATQPPPVYTTTYGQPHLSAQPSPAINTMQPLSIGTTTNTIASTVSQGMRIGNTSTSALNIAHPCTEVSNTVGVFIPVTLPAHAYSTQMNSPNMNSSSLQQTNSPEPTLNSSYSVTFSGGNPCKFIRGYKEFFKINLMSEVDMIQYVMQDFDGETLEWYFEYVEEKFLETWTPDCWEDFVIELYRKFTDSLGDMGSTISDDEYKEVVAFLIEENFSTCDVNELGSSEYHLYFIKRLVPMAIDRLVKEKEMASVLLSALHCNGGDGKKQKYG